MLLPVFKNRGANVFDILVNAAAGNPDRRYLVDERRQVTYRECMTAVVALAGILRTEYGIQPGDRVGIFAANSVEWVVTFWAIVAVGGIVSPMNSYWSDPETAYGLGLTSPKVVFADARRGEVLERVVPDQRRQMFDASFWKQLASGSGDTGTAHAPHEDDPVLLIFTSGTTGRPKAVVHAHRAFLGMQQCSVLNALLQAGGFPTQVPPPPRVLVGPPFFHLSALFGTIAMYTFSGGTLVMGNGRFDEERTLQTLQDEKITHWMSLGSAAPRVAVHPARANYDLSSLMMVMTGGSPTTPAVKALLHEAFAPPGTHGLTMGYTSSEAAMTVACILGEDFANYPHSTGAPQDGIEIAIRDDAGNDVPLGGEGNIWVRSPYTMLGYWNDPEATAAVFDRDGYYSMGDVGRLDSAEGGLLYLNSRARDLIFVSSENVYPTEVENRLKEHPAVIESCAAGIDDPMTGQAIKAFVHTDGTVTVAELSTWCRGALPAYKVPTAWDLRQEPLPRTATGKILRHQLAAGDS